MTTNIEQNLDDVELLLRSALADLHNAKTTASDQMFGHYLALARTSTDFASACLKVAETKVKK